MIDWLSTVRHGRDPRRVPAIHLAFVLSIALHAAALFWGWLPVVRRLPLEDPLQGTASTSLSLRLVPAAPEILSQASQPSPPPRSAPPKAPRSAPRLRPLDRPDPPAAPPPALPAVTQAPNPPHAVREPGAEDFAALVAARQRARAAATSAAEAPASMETEQERRNRTAAENLGLNRPATFGERPPGGGRFQVQSLGSNEAELLFFGWNKDIGRNAFQKLSVRRESNPSIEIAVVRRMVAVIRDHEAGDFIWESRRLGHNTTLSARVADNAGLEDFLMREFFPEYASRR